MHTGDIHYDSNKNIDMAVIIIRWPVLRGSAENDGHETARHEIDALKLPDMK